jgi:hypothetical protein
MPWVTMHQDLFEYVSLQIVKEEQLEVRPEYGRSKKRGREGQVR